MKTVLSRSLVAVGVMAVGWLGCDDGEPTPADAGSSADARATGADAVDAPAPDARAVDAISSDGAPVADAGMINVNRPEKRPFSPTFAQELRVPPGFRVQVFASGLGNPRMMAVAPEGDVYVTVRDQGQVLRLRDLNGDGDASDDGEQVTAASAMETPALEGVHGITYHMGRVYLATVKTVLVATPSAGRLTGITPLVMDLPDGGQHPNRTLAIGPDGKLYVTVGSTCNACAEPNSEHATIFRLEVAGTPSTNPANPQHPLLAASPMARVSPRVFASGLRNTLGFDWHPESGALWGSDHGSDGLGDDVPPDELNLLVGGKSYGWPYCWAKKQVDPVIDQPREELRKEAYCAATEPSVVEYPAHSAPIGFLFYRGTQFPAEYRGDAFVAFRGSWNRSVPTGYKVVRVPFTAAGPDTTRPTQEDFLTGLLDSTGRTFLGRPAGLAVDTTGALLLAEDTNGVIYRVSYGSGTVDGGADADGSGADGGASD
jgi:glucose/arabinose dehydrogenase